MTKKTPLFAKSFIVFWTIIRVIAVAFLWWNTLVGFFINIFLDAIDGDILERFKIKRDWYENWDKWLDLWFYFALAFFINLNVSPTLIKTTLLVLFVYRLIGSLLFNFLKKEWLLFVFPNVFTELFLAYVLFPNFVETKLWYILIVITFLSLIKEWWIHIAKIDLTNLITGKKKKWK